MMQGDLEPKSKSSKKREAHALQELGMRLASLSKEQLNTLGLPPELSEALAFAKTLKKHGAIRRQMQHIGALMRQVDPDPIRQALEQLDRARDQEVRQFQRAERWRIELVSGGDERLNDFLTQFPNTDVQQLRQLIRNTQKEIKATGTSKKSSRALFRCLIDSMKS